MAENRNKYFFESGDKQSHEKVKMDLQEFKTLIGDIESSPIFPECGEVYRCTVLNDSAPDRFWVRPLDENMVELRHTMNAVLKQLYSPLFQPEGEVDSEIRRCCYLLDVFLERCDSDSEGSVESLKELFDEYLALLGDYGVLYLSEEKTFYRVEIMHSPDYESEQKTALYLIDEGRFSTAPFQFIFPMSKKLVVYPRFAMCCYLDGVSPHGKVDQQTPVLEWPEDFLIKFKKLLVQNGRNACSVQFQELSARMPQGRFSVTFYSRRLNVNEVLYDFGKSRKPTPCAPLELENFNPMAAESEKNQCDVCVDNPAVADCGDHETVICELVAALKKLHV